MFKKERMTNTLVCEATTTKNWGIYGEHKEKSILTAVSYHTEVIQLVLLDFVCIFLDKTNE